MLVFLSRKYGTSGVLPSSEMFLLISSVILDTDIFTMYSLLQSARKRIKEEDEDDDDKPLAIRKKVKTEPKEKKRKKVKDEDEDEDFKPVS